MIIACCTLAAVIVLYWVLWFAHRSLVAAATGSVYVNFEQSFPLADGFIVVVLLLSAWALARQRSAAVLLLLVGAGAGFYLGGMDVLFDIEHGIWSRGANGAIELAINTLTFAAALVIARWTWVNRRDLDRMNESNGTQVEDG